MSKINLKSLENTVVHTPTKAEYDELMKIYEDAGWKWMDESNPTDIVFNGSWTNILAHDRFLRTSSSRYEVINLNEFKKIQNIESEPAMGSIDKKMQEHGVLKPKYQVGDVLVDDSGTSLVLAVCGYAILLTITDDYQRTGSDWFTQNELDASGYKLYTETPEPTKTKFTMQEIADKIGMGVDEFEIEQ